MVTADHEHCWHGNISVQALGTNSKGVFTNCMLQLACLVLYNMLKIMCIIVVLYDSKCCFERDLIAAVPCNFYLMPIASMHIHQGA